jgi:acetyl-CoA carboxylase carboxyltransferase component
MTPNGNDANTTKEPDAAALVHRRHDALLDAARPEAVLRQRKRGALTARERIALLLDEGSEFLEYGSLARPMLPGLEAPAEGVVVGTGPVHGCTVAVISYDYTALAGSQGPRGHQKLDRLLGVATARRCPVVVISEGAGARTQEMAVERPHPDDFRKLARLSGRVPLVGVAPGRAFAGHANLLGMTDVIIARRDAAMGIAGPPLVKAAMGVDVSAEEIGATEIHERAGTVDIAVDDDEAALDAARHYLWLLLEPTLPGFEPDDPSVGEALRTIVPANPRQAFDARRLVELMADPQTSIELRPLFGSAGITALGRIGGRSVGIVANNPMWQAGAIDRDAADKMTRFIKLCDTFGLPLVFLCDSPGFLVGVQAEQQALIRHSSRMLLALAAIRVPVVSVVVRRAYGLAYLAMGALSWDPLLHVVWPTAEFGAMGLRGASSITASASSARAGLTEGEVLAELEEFGGAFRLAERLQTDDVIDPGDTRRVLINALADAPRFTTDNRLIQLDAW